MRALVLATVVLAGCKTVEGPSGQGGAGFRAPPADAPAVPMEAMFGLCWSPNAASIERIVLTPLPGGDVTFEAKNGASNGTGWCVREIATSYPASMRPSAALELAPPPAPVELWAALAWVKLLSGSRFGPERGLLDPAPLVAACLERGTVREGAIAVDQTPVLAIRGLSPVIDSERCVEAVLAATAWPAPKDLRLRLTAPPRSILAAGTVDHYFAPEGDAKGVLEAQTVKETMRGLSGKIGGCWNETLNRRAGVGGSRTFRLRTDDNGVLVAAWVSSGLSDGVPIADALLDACIARTIAGARFPGTSGDGAYTWTFALRSQ